MKTIKNIIAVIGMALLFLGTMLIGTQANAQTWDGTHIYAPQYTKHFKASSNYAINEIGSEGGSEGFLITRSSKGLHFTMGIMENSYGNFSKYGMFGMSIVETNKIQLSAHIGVADNYNKAYWDRKTCDMLYKYLPYSWAYESLMPIAVMTIKHRITEHVGIQVNLSPAFINSGIYVQL
jgi:hypothetical protein